MDTIPVELINIILKYAYDGYRGVYYGIAVCKLWNYVLCNDAFIAVREFHNNRADYIVKNYARSQERYLLGLFSDICVKDSIIHDVNYCEDLYRVAIEVVVHNQKMVEYFIKIHIEDPLSIEIRSCKGYYDAYFNTHKFKLYHKDIQYIRQNDKIAYKLIKKIMKVLVDNNYIEDDYW